MARVKKKKKEKEKTSYKLKIRKPLKIRKACDQLGLATCWQIWSGRKNQVFLAKKKPITTVLFAAVLLFEDWEPGSLCSSKEINGHKHLNLCFSSILAS